MKKTIATTISILATLYYINDTLLGASYNDKQEILIFAIFIFPYVFMNIINVYLLFHSLFNKSKDIDDSNLVSIIAILGTNLSIFAGLFININTSVPNIIILYLVIFLRLATMPIYIIGVITLGYNLSILPEANTLNTKGIYSISRHPLYFCYIIWFVSQIFIYQSWVLAILSIIQCILIVLRAKYEERILEKNFPEYKEYKETVSWIGRKARTKSI